jgi:hypothetical protein
MPNTSKHYLLCSLNYFRLLASSIARVAMLSEKAKGKQRAVDPIPIPTPQPQPAAIPTRELTIRFTEGITDLLLTINPGQSVRDVKANVRRNC